MSEPTHAINYSDLTGTIYAGRIDAARRAFLDKTDVTDDALLAVALYVEHQFNGAMQMDFTRPGASGLRLRVVVGVAHE